MTQEEEEEEDKTIREILSITKEEEERGRVGNRWKREEWLVSESNTTWDGEKEEEKEKEEEEGQTIKKNISSIAKEEERGEREGNRWKREE